MNRTNENQFKATIKKKAWWLFHLPFESISSATIYCFLTGHSYKMAMEKVKTINRRTNFHFFFFVSMSFIQC